MAIAGSLQLLLVVLIAFCATLIEANSVALTSRELIILNEKLELKLPLDRDHLRIALNAGLVTNFPEQNKEIPFVYTPFGVFARECVLGVDGGSSVSDTENGDLLVVRKDGSSWVYQASDYKCQERFEPLNIPNRQHRKNMKNNNNSDLPAPLWQDGWLDNAWFQDSNEFGKFQSDYTVPRTPPATGGILFWFIGLESSNSDLAILQPVLVWDNIVTGWSFQSWYCCPSGTPNYATDFVTGFAPGDVLTGIILPLGGYGSDFNVSSCSSSRCSVLYSPAQGRTFGAADVTLETYHITDCSEFAAGTMTFSAMHIYDVSGSPLTPGWYDLTGATECSGSITVVSPTTVRITHQNS